MSLSWVRCLSATERSVSCPLSSVRSCYRSVSSLRRTLLSSWWRRESVALALFLAWLLGSSRSSVPRTLPPVLCGSGTGPGLSRARSIRHSLLMTWSLVLGLGWASAFVLLPSASFPWDVTVGGSCMSPRFERLSVLFPGNIGRHFFGISRAFLGNVLSPSLPQLLASSCPGSCGRVGGSAGLCLHPPTSMAPDPQRLSG